MKKNSSKYRIDRIDSEIKKEIQNMICNDIKDKRVSSFASVTEVIVSKDLSFCKVFVQTFDNDKIKLIEGLNSASHYIKKELSIRLNLRKTPDLKFEIDDSLDKLNHIEELLKKIKS